MINILCILVMLMAHPITLDVKLNTGDIIFQEACSSNTNDAIKNVTSSINDYNFTHMGIVWITEGNIYVLEATPPVVSITPIEEFLNPKKDKCPPKSIVGRLKSEYRHLIPLAIEEGQKLIGRDYDYAFDLNNDKYYCSEYIYYIFFKANNSKALFDLNKMTFINKETLQTDPNWITYFENINVPIPEGELGINPGAMSTSNIIDIISDEI